MSGWSTNRLEALRAVAEPLLRSFPVQRLASVTFLGILSPKYRERCASPLSAARLTNERDGGTRYEHTLGVAWLALEVARQLGLSVRGQRYAVAWGLLHDVATWPLSHTSEPSFAELTGWAAHDLREAMVLGSEALPDRYRLPRHLAEVDVDPAPLADLFAKRAIHADGELEMVRQLVRSPLTPDALEGMSRCGRVFGVEFPSSEAVIGALFPHRGMVYLRASGIPVALDFWRAKAEVYRRYINRPEVIRWESAWALAIKRNHLGISLVESLERDEEAIVEGVLRTGLPPVPLTVRYKPPQEYSITAFPETLLTQPAVGDLWQVLRREPLETLTE